MNRTSKKSTSAFTLVELIVVLAIIGLMAALVVPTFSRLSFGSRNEVNRAAREIFTLLRAAKVYAATYRVDTAVVYSPEDLYPAGGIPSSSRIRRVGAMAVFYKPLQPPPSMYGCSECGPRDRCDECFIPIPGDGGLFESLPEGTTIFLEQVVVNNVIDIDDVDRDRDREEILFQKFNFYNIGQDEREVIKTLGMTTIQIGELTLTGDEEHYRKLQRPGGSTTFFPAHIFKSSGRMVTADTAKERFRIYVAPSPELPEADREDPETGLIAIPIDLYRSTGRVKLAS